MAREEVNGFVDGYLQGMIDALNHALRSDVTEADLIRLRETTQTDLAKRSRKSIFQPTPETIPYRKPG